MRRGLRFLLGALLVVSLIWSGLSTARLFESGAARVWAEREMDSLAAAVDRQLARHADPATVAERIVSHLETEPRNWLALDAIRAEAERGGIALPSELAAEVEAMRAEDFGWMARTKACLRCARNTKHCSFDLVMPCGAPVVLSPIGDLRDVVSEGGKYLRGEDVDEVTLVLSAIGLGATLLVPLTVGASGTVKWGAALAKLARGMGTMPDWMERNLARTAREGFDWERLPMVRTTEDLVDLTRPEILRPAMAMLDDAGRIFGATGAAAGLYLLGKTTDAADLARLGRASEAMGERTLGTLEILGKSRFLRTTLRLSDEVLNLLLALATALAALAGLLGSALLNFLLRRARRAAGPLAPARR